MPAARATAPRLIRHGGLWRRPFRGCRLSAPRDADCPGNRLLAARQGCPLGASDIRRSRVARPKWMSPAAHQTLFRTALCTRPDGSPGPHGPLVGVVLGPCLVAGDERLGGW